MYNYKIEKKKFTNLFLEEKHFSKEFIKKINLCKNDLVSNLFYWIFDDIFKENSILDISEKFIDKYTNIGLAQTLYEIFEIFILFKNNQVIDYKKARYLYYCNGIISTSYYFNSQGKFTVIFLTVKDIIRELDGDEFFIWLEKMCIRNNDIN